MHAQHACSTCKLKELRPARFSIFFDILPGQLLRLLSNPPAAVIDKIAIGDRVALRPSGEFTC
jgi:hypothetical protein